MGKTEKKSSKTTKSKVTKTKKAGLIMPVGRIQRKLKEGRYADRIGTGAAVYMAGVLEYLASEMLELAGDAANANKNVRIKPRHVMMAVQNDEELKKLLKDVVIPEAGVVPFIHPVLLPPASKKKVTETAAKTSENSEIDTETENQEIASQEF